VVQALSTLRLSNITKRFGTATILEGLSVEIPLTGITFIVGASGSGKSVLCRLAVGLLKQLTLELEPLQDLSLSIIPTPSPKDGLLVRSSQKFLPS
jgi:ABC-type nitrate/sulfonate/bicarbonate transport system ATPase subunit